jgi:hypothetical protein
MGDPDTKYARSRTRKRNYIAKTMLQERQFKKKIHMTEKDRERQRKWRLQEDPTGDYEQLDDWLGGQNGSKEA